VKGYLLDTNIALIALTEPAKLSTSVREALLTGPNSLSVVSYWEVVLKIRKGSLDVGDPRSWWFDTLDQLAATPLLLRPEHISVLHTLPPLHKDPFDRALIAQATTEELDLVTTDHEFPRYASATLRVVV
jgi:PIN domain nuclease of toxin-antitoxin system